jgi:hypothetical protein
VQSSGQLSTLSPRSHSLLPQAAVQSLGQLSRLSPSSQMELPQAAQGPVHTTPSALIVSTPQRQGVSKTQANVHSPEAAHAPDTAPSAPTIWLKLPLAVPPH